MKIFKNLFRKSIEEKAMETLQSLGKKYMNGASTSEDLDSCLEYYKTF